MKKHAFIFILCALACFSEFANAQCGTCTDPGTQTVTWNGWSFSFVRPCLTGGTTSGGNGGHTPILNVKYQNDACGPYRDWQDQESRFACTNVTAAGRCDGPATTNCEMPNGEDTGAFCGVSVFESPTKLTLTTNVQAGWYRYVLKWHFFPDGSFHPEGLFGAVPASCVQNPHATLGDVGSCNC
jgi:hypothetical protein